MPAFSLGEPVALLFNTIKLSSTVKVSVFKIVCVPLTVKLPVIIWLPSTWTLLNVTLLVVSTAWPIAIAPVPDV